MILAAVLTLGAAFALIREVWRMSGTARVSRANAGSPYQNTDLGVGYVGDAACERCHAEITESYRDHPMGRSLSPIATAPATGNDQRAGKPSPSFEAEGLIYAILHRDGRVLHEESRQNAEGRVIAHSEAEIAYALGSGRRGIAYLVERDGFLFQSPISWYTQQGRWDLSPSYRSRNFHFERPILSECLFCHANQVEPVLGTLNRYQPPIFRGHAIGCERCHGPGERHISRPTLVDGQDMTIVNPARLESSIRDAVCEQCHLIGRRRVVRAMRRSEDFRPGLPFYRFWSAFVQSAETADNRFIGQVEQMHASRCFRDSERSLGCISCHDPHRLPSQTEKVAYYRDRCLECHADRGCGLSATVRLERNPANDCAGCHMPRLNSSDLPHVAMTDHRILRRVSPDDRQPRQPENPHLRKESLVNFHDELMDDQERALAKRDLGIALCRDEAAGAAIALPLLEKALIEEPDDVPAWESKGFALGQLQRPAEGLAAFRVALSKEPGRESSLMGAAYAAAQAGDRKAAIDFWRRAIAISPWRSDYLVELAPLYFQNRDWSAAAESCRQVLRLDPTHFETRKLLVRCELRLGHVDAASAELEALLEFDPPDRDELRRWFAPAFRSAGTSGP